MNPNNKEKKISKFLSYVLRHNPESIGLNLSEDGWADVKELIEKAKHKIVFDFNELKQVVKNNDKQRFALSDDFCEIRANQGHSTDVKVEFEEVKPPAILYHGAPNKVVGSIMKTGLKKMKRHHVHLSPDEKTAAVVGSRRGEFTILEIEAMRMRADGHKIYISNNGVYLVDEVPVKYIKSPF
ncbi:MAG TPA: RNA 2'-phosphotransferase [Thermodesulfobacteriota bacterium]|nr:RNA 2'-phosphotransferase [Thermodesulfobacteriota bacterium]